VARAASVAASSSRGTKTGAGNGQRSPYAPKDPGQGLGEHEVAAILELKKKHPSYGPAQLRAQLKRFKGWRLSNKAIARVLKKEGYQLVHGSGRPEGPEPIRFEAPRRNALWQADYTDVRVGSDKLQALIILDDFSRYIVGHALCDSPTSEMATKTLMGAIARHGKPEAVRTDRGGAFVAKTEEGDFARYLEVELIDHIVGHAYSPKGGGKVESAIGTLKRELWQVFEFHDREEAARRLEVFFAEYNEQRAHMGIDGLTPADRFFGRADQVLATIDAVSRKRQGAHALLAPVGAAIEELGATGTGAPMEVLRLVLVDGVMELRFCGARIELGTVDK
jgi:transposase InsO family protein